MPEYSQSQILSALRFKYPNLSSYSDDQLLGAYNKNNNLTPTGLPTTSKLQAEELPSYTPKHTGGWERFGKSFAQAAIPFAMYEPEMEEAEGFTEHLAGAMGGGLGFFAGAFPIAVVTGGAAIPLKASRGISLVSRIASKARAAEKSGKVARSAAGKRTFEETAEMLTRWTASGSGKIQPEALSLLGEGSGILGKSKLYRQALESVAKKGTTGVKFAKAIDIGTQNFITFAGYGQTHLKPNSNLEERWNQLKTDASTAALFTGLGAGGTRVALNHFTGGKKAAAITGEMFAMGLAGAYMSDMGQTDMPWEERLAHSVTLMLMHGFGLGMDRAERREGIADFLNMHGLSKEQANKIAYSETTNRLEKGAGQILRDDNNLFVHKDYQKLTEEIKVGRPSQAEKNISEQLVYRTLEVDKPGKGKPYVQYEWIRADRSRGKDEPIYVKGEKVQERIFGETIEEAQTNFNKKFARYRDVYPEEFLEPRTDRPAGRTEQDIATEKQIKKENEKLRRVNPEPGRPQVRRRYEIVDTSEITPEGTRQIVPKVDTVISKGEQLKKEITNLEKAIENKNYVVKNAEKLWFPATFLRGKDTPWHTFTKQTLQEQSTNNATRFERVPNPGGEFYKQLADKVKNVDKPKLEKLKEELANMSEWDKNNPAKVIKAEVNAGDWGRIPLYEGKGTFSSRQASLGRYVGKYKDLDAKTKAKVDTGGLEKTSVFDDALVYETFTPRGSEKLHLVALRERDIAPIMRSEFDPVILEKKAKLDLQEAEKAVTPTDLPGVSQKYKEEANYKFSLPVDLKLSDIADLKKGKLIHPDTVKIVERLKKEGRSIDSFVKELKKSEDNGVQLGNNVFYLARELQHKPRLENIEIVPVQVRAFDATTKSLAQTVYEVRFGAEHLPVEYNKGNYSRLWKEEGVTPIEPAANVPAKLTPNQRLNFWDNLGVADKVLGSDKPKKTKPINVREYTQAEVARRNEILNRAEQQQRGTIPMEYKSEWAELSPAAEQMRFSSSRLQFETKQAAEAYVASLKNKKYKKHIEFYKKEKMTPEKEKSLAENLELQQIKHNEVVKKGGVVDKLKNKEADYASNKIKEPASMSNLLSTSPYNPETLSRVTDNFNISIGSSKQLKLIYDRKQTEGIRFNNGDLLDANFSKGFKTEAEAHQWAQKHWVGDKGSKAISDAIEYRKGVIESQYRGTKEYKSYVRVKKEAKKTMSQYGAPYKSERMKNIIDTFFPEAKSNFDNLNTMELSRLNEMFRKDNDGNVIPAKLDMGVPPDDIVASSVNPSWLKFVEWASGSLPSSTILDATGTGGKYLVNLQIAHGKINRIGLTQGQLFGINFFKKMKPEHLEALQILREKRFEGARAGKHTEMIEFLKKKEVKGVKVPIYDKYGEISGYKKGQTMSLFDYGNMILDKLFDDFAYNQALSYSKVKNDISNKYEPFIEIRTKKDTKLRVQDITKKDLLAVMRGEKEKGDMIEIWNQAGTSTSEIRIGEIPYNHYVPNYFPRGITQKFWDFISTQEGNKYIIEKIIEQSPELLSIENIKVRRAVAEEMLVNLKGFSSDSKVGKIPDGQVFSRVADLDAWIYYDKVNKELINPYARKVFKEDGTPFKVNDKIKDVDGRTLTVGKAVQVYSTKPIDIINKYVKKTSKSIASYKAFGGIEGLTKPVPEQGINIPANLLKMKADIIKTGMKDETAKWFEDLAMRVMKDQMFGRDYDYPFLGKKLGPAWWSSIGTATRASATIGLSFPLSGIKNFALGQTQLGVLSGREYLKAWYHLMTSPEQRKIASALTEAAGVRGGNTYDIFIKPKQPLYGMITKPKGLKDAGRMGLEGVREGLIRSGLMRPTEYFNRYMAVMMTPGVMKVHLDNLLGIKNFSNRGYSKATSRAVLTDNLRFTNKQLDEMLARRKAGGEGWTNEQLISAADRMHSMTQGIGEHPYIPYIMGREGFKPLTLFYRIAYRMTDHIAKTVIKPTIYQGNIWPMMKYVGLSMASGELMYSTYWYAFGEERKNRFKDAPATYWENFIRAVGLGIFSNAFDEYGSSISDSYTPVVFRNFLDLSEEAMNIMHGKKDAPEGLNSLAKKTIAAYSGYQRVYRNLTKETRKRVQNSRRRQTQFLNAYFPDYRPVVEASDALTRKSPYYENLRNIFWLDTPEEKAHAYYTALNYLTHTIQRQDVALAKNEAAARNEARKRIRNILSKIRPIPASWRKRDKGEMTTKYRLYKSKLTPEQMREEMILDELYKQKKREFWKAVSEFR